MADNEQSESVVPENGSGDAAADQVQDQVEDPIQQQIQQLKEERDSLYDRLLRKQAEFENYKRRMERERAEFAQFASGELMKEILNALDSFELAIRNASGASGASGDDNILRGFELIYKQLLDVLGRFGLKALEAKGQMFDPNFHQAVSTDASDEVPENTVLEEMRRGYLLNGRLLRPAMVSVSVRKSS